MEPQGERAPRLRAAAKVLGVCGCALGAGLLGGRLLASGAATGRPAAARITVLSSLETIRPGRAAARRGRSTANIEAARGEWESFQVAVWAGGRGLASLDVDAPPLRGPRGGRVVLRPSRVLFLDLHAPSNREGAAGRWPDPLLPVDDALTGEPRRAFPVAVAAGEEAVVWVDLYVPREAPSGDYLGELLLRDGARPLASIPVQLRVHRFTLPATSTLPVSFGFSTAAAARGLLGRAPSAGEALSLARRFGLSALRHRVSLHGGTFEAPPCRPRQGGGVEVDFTRYDAEVGPFLDGTADPRGPAEGARWSAVDLRAPACPASLRREGEEAMARHLAERGWLDRAFAYVADEPRDDQLDPVALDAARLASLHPAVRRLVTTAPTPRLPGVDRFCPPLYLVDNRPAPTPLDALRPLGAEVPRAGLWWYQSCLSHGCDGVGDGWFTGWPSLAIDAPAVSHRVLEWLTFAQGVGGELYYNTVEAWADGDPWVEPLRHGGNGDGTLFYPGLPERIGGHTPIPLESIRLRRVRDGLEDYEYLALLARHGPAERAFAEEAARSLAPRAFRFDHDPDHLLAIRARLAARLDQLEATAASATPPVAR